MGRRHKDGEPAADLQDDKPELLSQGTYATMRTPRGGLVIVYRPVGVEEDQHIVIPPKAVRFAEKAMAGEMPLPGPLASFVEKMMT